MSESTQPRRALVLLLAGDLRERWTRALEAGGLEVTATGWLDGVTAARIRRPDVVLVSMDLPESAPQMVCNGFRMSTDLARIPIVVVGPGSDRLDQHAPAQLRADHYLPQSIDGEALAARVREAAASGRIRWLGSRASRVVVGLLLFSGFALMAWLLLTAYWGLSHTRPTLESQWLAFAAIVVPFAAALAVGLAARTRPLSIAERRSALGWLGLFFWNGGRVVPGGGMLALFAGWTLGSLALAAWAWLGPSPTPWFKRSRRAFQLLAGALVLLAVAPWAAVLWYSSP